MEKLSQREKDRILARAAEIVKERQKEYAKTHRPKVEVDDAFHDSIEQHAKDNNQTFEKSLAFMAQKNPAEFSAYRQRVYSTLESQEFKERKVRDLTKKLPGPQEFSQYRKLAEHVDQIMEMDKIDYPAALKLFAQHDPRSFGEYRQLYLRLFNG